MPEITRSPQHAGQGTVDALADWGIPKDRIDKLVEDGAVVGVGTHSELVESTPLYRDLAKHQLLV